VPHLALPNELTEDVELLGFRDLVVDSVQLPEIDAIELQSFQASVERLSQVLGPAVGDPLVRAGSLEAALRGDHQTRRVRMQRLGDQLFGYERPVGVRRVDEIHAELHGAPEHANRLVVIGWRSPHALAGDAHGAIAHATNRQVPAQSDRPRGRSRLDGECRDRASFGRFHVRRRHIGIRD
jgi:hypothetical protein